MASVRVKESRRFIEECLVAAGAGQEAAREQAAMLIHADVTGHFSHGLNRLAFYINDIKCGAANPHAKPAILKESAATAWVDGGSALGASVGNFCMDLAIKKAKASGVGVVSVKRSNHFGMAGWWALKAEREGLIGMAFTNSSPILVPTRAKNAALGTNPLAMFAPATGGDSVGVDMASTTVALGKVEVQIHKGEPIPEGWALGPNGLPTTDAKLAMKSARLTPLGGAESTSGYKGYALGAVVEVMCALSGAYCSHEIRSWSTEGPGDEPNLGQCYIAIDPDRFAPGFEGRVSSCLKHWRNLEPLDPSLPVLAPGDKERQNAERTMSEGFIRYAPNLIEVYDGVAKNLGVKPLEVENV